MFDFKEISISLGSIEEFNEDISNKVGWSAEEIFNKTGIKKRFISSTEESAEELALEAIDKLSSDSKENIDLVISVSNTQKNNFPPIANYAHTHLNLNSEVSCYGLNHGCSGFVDALRMSYAFLSTSFYKKVLILTSDTYSKYIDEGDRSIRTLFSDGAAATIISKNENSGWRISDQANNSQTNSQKFLTMEENLISMNGPQVLLFSLNTVAKNLLKIIPEEEAILYPHQAGKIVLDGLKKKIPKNITLKENYENYGNLVSTSIPNLLSENFPIEDKIKKIILSGFGVGLSHSSILLERD